MTQPRGKRRDSSLATQRRLYLVRQLLRGPATAGTLIAQTRSELGSDIFPGKAQTAFRHDLVALRDTFGCEFVYRGGEGYFLTSLGTLTLLDLAGDDLEALALLLAAITEGVLPQTKQMKHLRSRILALMTPENRAELVSMVPSMRLDVPIRTTTVVDTLIVRLRPALGRCEVTFHYRSPYTAEDQLEKHRVAPYALVQRDGATYLDAYCLESSLPKLNRRTIFYRLDRIVPNTLRRLPQQLPPIRYSRRSYQLRYILGPQVARRRDVPLWFEHSTCTYQQDGSMVVEAVISDLWHARQILLRYHEHCLVVEPPELVAMMRHSIAHMYALYHQQGDELSLEQGYL